MIDLAMRRLFYAEEIQAAANLSSSALVEALATVPRERFLGDGPWTVRSEADVFAPPRRTPDADPRHVYHNVAVAIDVGRILFNGAPSVVASAIDALGIQPGDRVLHIGTGTGYYTAILAHCAGAEGRVVGIEVDADLAARARTNLESISSAEVRQGDGSAPLGETFDVILVNAGVTHPLDAWLDALRPSGRMVLPITATMPQMGTIGKGVLVRLARGGDDESAIAARVLTFVAIYSAVGVRDDVLNAAIGAALARNPFPKLARLRRDRHEQSDTCWLHGPTSCLSLATA